MVGIHLETLANSSKNFTNESGWVNIEITKNDTPRGDYTHRGKFVRPKGKSFTEQISATTEKKEY